MAQATSLASNLPKGVNIDVVVKLGTPALEIARRAGTLKVELTVMGRGGGGALRDVFLGATAERVLRRGQLPVLVVRPPPRGPYRRPALALELDQAAHGVLKHVADDERLTKKQRDRGADQRGAESGDEVNEEPPALHS